MMKLKTTSFIALMILSSTAGAYECKDSIEATTRAENFLNNSDGTITDLRFGLMWQICSYGQKLDTTDGRCKGEQKNFPTWSDAILSQDAINAEKANGYSDWRLPSIKELQSIVERKCRQPAINDAIFNGTAVGAYWSNTPDSTINPQLGGRIIDFTDGVEFYRSTAPLKYVRHVRVISN